MNTRIEDTVTELRELFAKWGDDPGIAGRDLICTPIKANYALASAWLISMKGSPPRGNLYIEDNRAVLLTLEPRVLSGEDLEVVHRFYKGLRKDWPEAEGPVTIR